MEQPVTVTFYSQGQVTCFDKNGQQVAEFQESWLSIWFGWLEAKGIDPKSIQDYEIHSYGVTKYVRPFKTERGWNYSIYPGPKQDIKWPEL